MQTKSFLKFAIPERRYAAFRPQARPGASRAVRRHGAAGEGAAFGTVAQEAGGQDRGEHDLTLRQRLVLVC